MAAIVYEDFEKLLFRRQTESDIRPSSVQAANRLGYRSTSRGGSTESGHIHSSHWTTLLSGLRKKKVFLHKYSRLANGHIRFLVLNQGQSDDPIETALLSAPLDKSPNYSALSYEWGNSPPVYEIKVRDFTAELPEDKRDRLKLRLKLAVGPAFYVRKSLLEALRQLRSPREKIVLWVDAICINQRHSKEKTSQIAMMAQIYNRAQNVKIWLGNASDQSDEGMLFVKELAVLHGLRNIVRHQDSRQKVLALLELLRSRWFSRRWVIQELAVAKQAHVYCGGQTVHWDDFEVAITQFTSRLRAMQLEPGNPDAVELEPQGISALEAFGANSLVSAQNGLLEKSPSGVIERKNRLLEHLVSTLVSFDALDPRDTVYALVAIAKEPELEDQRQTFPRPNYSKSVLETLADFVLHCVTTSGSIDIVCRHWAPTHTSLLVELSNNEPRRVETTLPSWIQSVEKSPFGPPDKVFRGRKHADSLVGDGHNYQASAREPVWAEFGRRSSPNNVSRPSDDAHHRERSILTETYDGTLSVKGIVLGKVKELSGRMIPGVIPHEVVTMGGWQYSLLDQAHVAREVPDRLWRTLVANRGPFNQPTTNAFRVQCLLALQQEDASGDIRIAELIANKESSSELIAYLRRVHDVCFNRKAFLGGDDNDLFGLCPKETEKDDLICIVHGCSVPVILREVQEDDPPILGQRLTEKRKAYGDPISQKDAWARGRAPTKLTEEVIIEDPREGEVADTPCKPFSAIKAVKRSQTQTTSSAANKSSPTTTSSEYKSAMDCLAVGSPLDEDLFPDLATGADEEGPPPAPLANQSERNASRIVTPSGPPDPLGQPSKPLESQTKDIDSRNVNLINTDSMLKWASLPSDKRPTYYRLIGECYVDNMMQGEALNLAQYFGKAEDLTLI